VQPEEAGNKQDDDHNADDVKNVHFVLLSGMRNFGTKRDARGNVVSRY
jgi:hypothetical protein